MTPTERLREMLDEHGVEWRTYRGIEKQITCVDSLKCVYEELERGKIRVIRYFDTPAEAIEGTLGHGECHADETEAIKCWVKAEAIGSERMELIHVMECSEYGGTYEHVNGGYEFCPRCGRKVVEE